MSRLLYGSSSPAVALLCNLGFLSGSVLGQTNDIAAQIYQKTSLSIFLISVRDGKGSPISLGTGFLVGKNTIATNLHVVEGGEVFLEDASMRVPAIVEKRDVENDLAIIRVSIGISAKPLTLSEQSVVPGQNIFAIGNPEGLEKSISTGIIAALRQFNGRKLLQITAPISHGSSGGPILNSRGEVVGIAVAMLKDGQNLNFAVPAELIRTLLTRTANRPINSVLESALEQAGSNPGLLLKVAEEAETENLDIMIEAAGRAIRLKPSAESNFLLGKGLYRKGVVSEAAEKGACLGAAREALSTAIQMSSTLTEMPKPEMYNILALIIEEQGSFGEAAEYYHHGLKIAIAAGNAEQQRTSLRGLASTAHEIGQWR